MDESILQLYPPSEQKRPLRGLYLNHNIRQQATQDKPFVYTNFVTSLDGRISIPDLDQGNQKVPPQIINDRDWRLFQELALQADIVITSGRYLRDYAAGKAQEILRIYDDPNFADIHDWRAEQGLSPQPDLAVISGSLNFPIPETLTANNRKVVIFTTAQSDASKRASLEAQAGQVFIAGEEKVNGRKLVNQLHQLGYNVIYSGTGPKVHHLLLETQVLDRLYLTFAGRLLGSNPFSSIVEGELLEPAIDMKLNTMYYDTLGLDGLGQLFASYNCQYM